ncbi:MAG: hypothetical protein JWQ47_2410 [Glaciihabitans sp.]|nr:hypothetical protein [Glaciihabitans sp.]
MGEPDYFEVLGFSRTATDHEILTAYLLWTRQPQRDGADSIDDANEALIERAFITLSRPEARRLWELDNPIARPESFGTPVEVIHSDWPSITFPVHRLRRLSATLTLLGILEVVLVVAALAQVPSSDAPLSGLILIPLVCGAAMVVAPTALSGKITGYLLIAGQLAIVIWVPWPSDVEGPRLVYVLCFLATGPILISLHVVARMLYREVRTARGASSWQALLDDVAENTGAGIYCIVSVRRAGLNSALKLQPLAGERTLFEFTIRGFPPSGSWLALTGTGVIIGTAPRGARAAYYAAFAHTSS